MERIAARLALSIVLVAAWASAAHSELSGMPGSSLSGVNLQSLGLANLSTQSFFPESGLANPAEPAAFLSLSQSQAVFSQSSSASGSAGFAFQSASAAGGAMTSGAVQPGAPGSPASVVTQSGNTVALNGVVSHATSFQFAQSSSNETQSPGIVIMPLPPSLTPPTYAPFVGLITVSDPVVLPADPPSTGTNSPVLQPSAATNTQGPQVLGAPLVGPWGVPGAGIIIGFTPLIPEPSSLTLLGLGALALAGHCKLRKRRRARER
jgi:hypothetical protein